MTYKALNPPINILESKVEREAIELSTLLPFLMLLMHYILNFLGTPLLKYYYLIEILISLFFIIFRANHKNILFLLLLLMVEGQGRILGNYHIFFRIIFDVVSIVFVGKIFISNKKLLNPSVIPVMFYSLFALHFFWFCWQIVNPNSISAFAVIASSKIYIYPMILFMALSYFPFEDPKIIRWIGRFILFYLLFENLLVVYQFIQKESFLLQISPYYKNKHGEIFVGPLFRSLGSTMLSGAYSVYFCYSSILSYQSGKKESYIWRLLVVAVLLFTAFSLFISQVRASMIKFLLIHSIFLGGMFLIQRNKLRRIFSSLFFMFLTVLVIQNTNVFKNAFVDLDLESSISRITALFEKPNEDYRANKSIIFSNLTERLAQNPLGLAPGRTGAVANISKKDISNDPIYTKNNTWAFDNLLIALAIDFGWGMIFYLALIVLIPFRLFYFLILYYGQKNQEMFVKTLMPFSVTTVILIGNWGAIGLPYNPESFFFWFFAAYGFRLNSRPISSLNAE